jgi:major membrane immunogen (membrane-anchored lipoprotein)
MRFKIQDGKMVYTRYEFQQKNEYGGWEAVPIRYREEVKDQAETSASPD